MITNLTLTCSDFQNSWRYSTSIVFSLSLSKVMNISYFNWYISLFAFDKILRKTFQCINHTWIYPNHFHWIHLLLTLMLIYGDASVNSVHLKGFVLSFSIPLCLGCFFDFWSLEFFLEQILQGRIWWTMLTIMVTYI